MFISIYNFNKFSIDELKESNVLIEITGLMHKGEIAID